MTKDSNFDNPSTGNDQFTKALIDQLVTYGAELQLIQELVRKIPNPTAAVAALEQHVENLVAQQATTITTIDKSTETLKKIADRLLLPAASIGQLSQQLQQHAQLFEKPLKKSVHYTHFVGKSLLVCTFLCLVIIVVGFFYGLLRTTANGLEENDIKWRHAKLSASSEVLKLLSEADDTYRADPKGFKKTVITEEERRKQLFDTYLKLKQAQNKMQELQKQEKKP